MTDSTRAAADQQVLITRIFDAPREARVRGLDRSRRGRGVVRPRALRHAARADPHRPARRRALRAHDGPARQRRRVRDRLRHRRARRAGAARPALGPDAGDRDARADGHARGVPRPRRQDAHDAQRRSVLRAAAATPRPAGTALSRSSPCSSGAERILGPSAALPVLLPASVGSARRFPANALRGRRRRPRLRFSERSGICAATACNKRSHTATEPECERSRLCVGLYVATPVLVHSPWQLTPLAALMMGVDGRWGEAALDHPLAMPSVESARIVRSIDERRRSCSSAWCGSPM